MPRTFEQGGLPPRVRARVEAQAASGHGLATTTLTVAEAAVARMAGYTPLSQVMGSSFYHVGWARTFTWSGGEVVQVAEAHRAARTLALGRMWEEAAALRADAVVDIRLEGRVHSWASGVTEFTAVGTAVRVRDGLGGPPVLAMMTVQELYKLEQMGLWPVGIGIGSCTWYEPHADCRSDGIWLNCELPTRTQLTDRAQALALSRFRESIAELGAASAVGLRVERRFHEHEYEMNDRSHTAFEAQVILLGTGVVRRAPAQVVKPRLVLDLGDRKVDLGERAEFTRKED